MRRRVIAWAVFACLVTGSTAIATSSCSSSPTAAGLASGCAINSDCNSPLVCAFSLCHEQCAETRDCPTGQRCVAVGADKVCQLPQENACNTVTPCGNGLICASDNQCRNSCSINTACSVTGQLCVNGACYEPSESPDATSDAPSDTGVADTSIDTSVDTGSDVTGDAGCVADAGTNGPLGYTPSNFDPSMLALVPGTEPDGGVDWANAPNVDVTMSNCGADCMPAPSAIVTMSDGSHAHLIVAHDFIIHSGAALTINTVDFQYPLIIAASGKIEIQGALNAGGSGIRSGVGGNPSYAQPRSLGAGAGGSGGSGTAYPNSASGGGGFCGNGGSAAGVAPLAPGGQAYGTADLIPLLGASAAGSNTGAYQQGYSGGSIQLSARTSILVTNIGSINVGGDGCPNNSGGGGSGGAVLLEAPTVSIQGRIGANGGAGCDGLGGSAAATANDIAAPGGGNGGNGSAGAQINGGNGVVGDAGVSGYGSGGGGAGWIRVNTYCGAATIGASAVVSPSVTTTCTTQGTLTH